MEGADVIGPMLSVEASPIESKLGSFEGNPLAFSGGNGATNHSSNNSDANGNRNGGGGGGRMVRGLVIKAVCLIGGAFLLRKMTKTTTRRDHARMVAQSLSGEKVCDS
jgi:hypothetical protein